MSGGWWEVLQQVVLAAAPAPLRVHHQVPGLRPPAGSVIAVGETNGLNRHLHPDKTTVIDKNFAWHRVRNIGRHGILPFLLCNKSLFHLLSYRDMVIQHTDIVVQTQKGRTDQPMTYPGLTGSRSATGMSSLTTPGLTAKNHKDMQITRDRQTDLHCYMANLLGLK